MSAIPETGQFSFSTIQTVFGGSAPISLSEYYTNASSGFTTGIAGIPASGAFNLGVFKGKSKSTQIITNLTYFSGMGSINNTNVTSVNLVYNSKTYTLVAAEIASSGSLSNGFNQGSTIETNSYMYRSNVRYTITSNAFADYTGSVQLTDAGGTVHRGLWLGVNFPYAVSITSYRFNGNGDNINSYDNIGTWVLLASNTNAATGWTVVDSRSMSSLPSGFTNTTNTFIVGSPGPYQFYRLVVKQTYSTVGQGTVVIKTLRFMST
jgi:ribosomal protein L31